MPESNVFVPMDDGVRLAATGWKLDVEVDEDGERLVSRSWSREVPRALQ